MFIVVKLGKTQAVTPVTPQELGWILSRHTTEQQAYEAVKGGKDLIYVQVDRKGRLIRDLPAYSSTRLN